MTQARRLMMENKNRMLQRHTIDAMLMHWFNTICWILLLATGVGLIDNPVLQPLCMWWVKGMHAIFGGGAELLEFHITVGAIWSVGFLVYGIIRFKRITLPFIKEMLTFSPMTDIEWLIKKPLSMTIGSKMMQRFGLKPNIPDQGFYNVGQKMFGIPALFGGAVIAVTGWVMTYSKQDFTTQGTVQWMILIHFLTVGLVFAGLLVHIYMAAIAKGETPAFLSMFTGKVPADYAASHHKVWFDEYQADTREQTSEQEIKP
jgi:formate dehydrogenase subunit gamma